MSTTIHEEQPNQKPKKSIPKTEKQARDASSGGAKARVSVVSDTARATSDAAVEAMDDMRDGVSDATEKARTVAQEQPLMAVAGAMAIGVALGFALGNRRS